jgi:hypothetical protein
VNLKNGEHFIVSNVATIGCRIRELRQINPLTVLSAAIRIGISLLIAPLDKLNECIYGEEYMREIWSGCKMSEVTDVKTQIDRIKKQLDEGNASAFKLDVIEFILNHK